MRLIARLALSAAPARTRTRRTALAVLVLGAAAMAPAQAAHRAPTAAPATTSSARSATPVAPAVGADISWPQCPTTMGIPERRGKDSPMPSAKAKFVVVGLTNGPAFHRNPCLDREVRWMHRHHVWGAVYSVTSYPRPVELAHHGAAGPYRTATLAGKLRNVGWAQARFNLATMRKAAIVSPVVWVDVEPVSGWSWSGDRTLNRAVVSGIVAGYQKAGLKVGVYSTQSLWTGIVGTARYGVPEWRTAGGTSQRSALSTCSHASIQGGPAVIAQWWVGERDHDVTCPGYRTPSAVSSYFRRY